MNKIKDIIKCFFKENYKGILILVFIFVLFNYKLDFSIYTPGGIINMSDRIESSDNIYKSSGSINMSYVKMVRGTIPTYVIAKILPTWDIVPNSDITYDGDMDETIKIDQYYLKESISNAYKVAYDAAGVKYSINSSDNYVTYIYKEAKTNLKVFDNIIKYDNIEFSTFSDMQDYVSSKKVGDVIKFLVLRNNKKINCEAELISINGNSKIGLTAAIINDYNSDIDIDVKTKNSESGSSGGFMTALAIYNSLVKKDITNGKKIAGTGTIDIDGNVGEIGGVIYKLSGAVKNKVDVFLVPDSNYKEALNYKNKHSFDIELVSISKFSDAIEYLNK